jgi:hypothetical protein
MRKAVFALVVMVFLMFGFLYGLNFNEKMGPVLPSMGDENVPMGDNPPPIDSLCLVFSGIDYGGPANSPQAYPHAKHVAYVKVGSYYFPVVTWETDVAWKKQSLFSYWDDMFKFWSYPDSFTSNGNEDTGRPSMVADSKGNLHFVWHQLGMPDGYEVFYSRAILDTSAGMVLYNVERPAVMLSETNGQEETFPSIQIYQDTLLVAVFPRRSGTARNAIAYNYSTDGGNTWAGQALAYDHGGTMPGSWIECSIAADPNTGDMWAATNFDYDGDNNMEVVMHNWDASSNTWSTEIAADPPMGSSHPFCLPACVVDSYGIPHIIFLENPQPDGGIAGLTVFYASGPFGQLYYSHRSGGTWSSPMKVDLPVTPIYNNYCNGWASTGIASDNTIYFSITQPESVTADTSAYGTFNVHYAELSPYTGAISYGSQVSNIPPTSTVSAIYPHMTYEVFSGGEVPAGTQGPGISWCQLDGYAPPADCYFYHSDTLAGITGIEDRNQGRLTLYQNYPNPVREKTMIRFTVPANTDISLSIHDITGRLINTIARGIPGAGSYFAIWDGKDSNGNKVPSGVYLYTLKSGSYTDTKKLILVQ